MKEFVMRGQTASGLTHTINFSGHKGDYGFRLTEFQIYPSTNITGADFEGVASLTAAKSAMSPNDPDYNSEGLIGTVVMIHDSSDTTPITQTSVVNDTFIITQDIILMVFTQGGVPVNWQCKFMPVKLSTSEAALTNYRQFSIFDE